MMTRKDYQNIANVLKSRVEDERSRANGPKAIAYAARDLASIFAAENPRFDRVRFYAACGVTELLSDAELEDSLEYGHYDSRMDPCPR